MDHHRFTNDCCAFRVWAPDKKSMRLHLPESGRVMDMTKETSGFFIVEATGVRSGDRYWYQPEDEKKYPDPASHFQPEGVHGPSACIDHSIYSWQDSGWNGVPLAKLIFYELHVGTFTPEGTFEAIIPRLKSLAELGINAIELMPVAQNPGERNWGYDAVFPYAVQHNYGGPEGLKKLVDACHQHGISIFLDVVYNHIGPEGNYLSVFGPYFSDKYHTPWGKAINFDGAWSDGVKEYICGNILHWAEHYHFDGLRLDAVHEIYDRNAVNIWGLIHETVNDYKERSGHSFHLIAESDHNSPRAVKHPELGGMGMDAQWLDDFHHSLYVLLDEKGLKHYADFGRLEQLAKAYTDGFVHSGEYVQFRKRAHGASSRGVPGYRFVVFNQNHDLPGNRPGGERLSMLVDSDRLKLAAAAVLLSPYLPLLFMGEEYGETAPFYFFSDYHDPTLTDHLKENRRKEFLAFDWGKDPLDSQELSTFSASKLNWHSRTEGTHGQLLEWHKALIHLRKARPLLNDLSKNTFRADMVAEQGLILKRHDRSGTNQLFCLLNFSDHPMPHNFSPETKSPAGPANPVWKKILDSGQGSWANANVSSGLPETIEKEMQILLPPWSVVVYEITSGTKI